VLARWVVERDLALLDEPEHCSGGVRLGPRAQQHRIVTVDFALDANVGGVCGPEPIPILCVPSKNPTEEV